jgi:hypothetical protein
MRPCHHNECHAINLRECIELGDSSPCRMEVNRGLVSDSTNVCEGAPQLRTLYREESHANQ